MGLEVYHISPETEHLRPYLLKLQELVERNAEEALVLSHLDRSNSKLALWHKRAMKSLEAGTFHPLAYASYGYAVEELTNLTIDSIRSLLPFNSFVQLQVTTGSTRPDIVLYQQKEPDFSPLNDYFEESLPFPETLAWIDITSDDSLGHIKEKVGGKWGTAPCVCEVTYPTLRELSQISCGQGDLMAHRARAASAQRRNEIFERKLYGYMITCMDCALENLQTQINLQPCKIRKADVPSPFIKQFHVHMAPAERHVVIYSMLLLYLKLPQVSHPNTAQYLVSEIYKHRQPRNKSLAKKYIMQSYQKQDQQEKFVCFTYNDDDDG